MDNFYELASKRQSCRNYSDRPVEKEKLAVPKSAAIPSACNSVALYPYYRSET